MLTRWLLLALTAPFAPQLQEPQDGAWTIGQGAYFVTSDFADDAGVPAASVRIEFRRDDAGYGGFEQTQPYDRGFGSNVLLPVEGARWCWRVSHLNTLGQSSPPSNERCFRTDFTPPTSPAFVDAGAVVSTGRVFIDSLPATDALSGVQGYYLQVGPTLDERYDFLDPELQRPLVAYVGAGNWVAWVLVTDRAGNDNRLDIGAYAVPLNITADPAVPTPEPPAFEQPMVNQYGSALLWDAGWMSDAGVTHVVSSFCNLDAGCLWRHGFHTAPVADDPRRWLQVGDEGTVVARIAVVQGGKVGLWSGPSAPLLVDRTPPPIPSGLAVSPLAGRAGPLALTWSSVTDNLTGWGSTLVEVTAPDLTVGQHEVLAPMKSSSEPTAGDGLYQFRVASLDRVGNQSGWSAPVSALIDSTGPVSMAPMALAAALDGGALVSISWVLPVDALSRVATEELEELAVDGGAQVFSVTGLGASRLVRPGSWRWRLRATDSLGNVGAFSAPSNVIVVTDTGVAVGPSIDASAALTASCGVPFTTNLVGSGDAPLVWTLRSGPAGLLVDAVGQLSWTPQAAGSAQVVVDLSNSAGSVSATLTISVSCEGVDGGGSPPVEQPSRRLAVGCGCTSVDSVWAWLVLLLGSALRRQKTPPAG